MNRVDDEVDSPLSPLPPAAAAVGYSLIKDDDIARVAVDGNSPNPGHFRPVDGPMFA